MARPAGAGSLRAGWGWPGARSRPPRPPCAAASQGHVWGGTCAAAALRGRGRSWAGRGGADVGPARADAGGGRGGAGPRPGSRGGGGAEKAECCLACRALRGPQPGGLGEAPGPVQAAPRGRGPPRPAPPRARLRAREAWPAACAPPPPRVSRGGAGKPGAWEREPPRRTAAAARWRRSRGRPAASRARVGTRLRRLPERRKPPRAAPPSADERTCAASEALAARFPLKPGADGTCAEPGPNVLKSSEGDLGMCSVGTVLVWCLRRPGFDSCVLLWLYSQHSESGGWRFKSSRSSRLIGSQPGMRETHPPKKKNV